MAPLFLIRYRAHVLLFASLLLLLVPQYAAARVADMPQADTAVAPAARARERIDLNDGWRFSRFTSNPDSLSYSTLKNWILPSANDFLSGAKHVRPSGTPPGSNIQYVKPEFDDSTWEALNLPHDWAVKGPFNAPGINGGMGRLPSNGVGWYRKTVTLAKADLEKTIFLDIDGAMSYSAVWLNGVLVGGWPYGYNSFRLDLTPYAKEGANQLAIRLDNAVDSSRWYPGAGIYRNVWLVKVNPVHVRQFGTYATTPKVSAQSATVNLVVAVDNTGSASQEVSVKTEIRLADPATAKPTGEVVATIPAKPLTLAKGATQSVNASVVIDSPQLWGPPPTQKPNLYVATTSVSVGDATVDTYETRFGIRSLTYDANRGLLVNGEHIRVQGTCNHHDLGSLGAAFNVRAAERQLQILGEMGTNALRTSHNPPAPEFLELADRLGFLVYDEIFDCWNTQKTTNDFHLIFADWSEPDLRSFVRRDRNHPSVIAWGIGNEIPEQSSAAGGATGRNLRSIILSEDTTRPTTAGLNSAGAGSALAGVLDIEGLNYQGEGLGTSTNSAFPGFHSAHPGKLLWSSESSSAVSTRGTYIFPVTGASSATVGSGSGGNASASQVSAYELYATSWGSSPDKVFEQQDRHDYVAGEFVWTGFDYIGEPTPYDSSRSSYFGIVDMAGFPKDRFYLYQARWRPDLPMAHILPHWTWPSRVGQVTPVHVFSSGDEAELFVNGQSAGRKKRAQYAYRFRWDDVRYQAGDLRVVTYKDGKEWATDTKKTAGAAAKLKITADRSNIAGDGYDLSFITVAIVDAAGEVVPEASNNVTFSITGPGKIVSTDNGNPADFTVFPSPSRKAFGGLVLSIIRPDSGASGDIVISAASPGLPNASVTLHAG
ncbi:putative glycoside hydrolase family 2 protein [Rosellinia necatrix]|uniref:Putative glycoside hydrolase family 2 protein n=1 Tax=Rosellinia necatrix TaxID=77044 RepID=A0A1W2TP87_ROSNE|nr:putative glycoside hydrolase family 2 protein [Rosellinia necatrix]